MTLADTLLQRCEAALAEYDASMARCPVNNPKHGKTYGPHDRCPRCSAKASGTCGLSSSAGYHLEQAIRSATRAQAANGDGR